MERLALLGGEKAVQQHDPSLFKWPIITEEDEAAALEVLRAGTMSGTDVTLKFEEEMAQWHGTKYALAFNNGTNSLLGAMYGCKVGVGDEIICASISYWAAALPALSLGASVVLADIDPQTLCLDPKDMEAKITDKTKAVVVVHNYAHPADMDEIMAIARKYGIKVIEDVSHAQGGYYKGRKLGTIGDVGAMSLMTGKSFAIGEGGMFVTNDREIYERAIALGHYERFNDSIETQYLRPYKGLPLGGCKFRMHQVSSAVGRVQLKYYDQRIQEIDKAMNYFWDQLEGVPGIRAIRPPKDSGSTMAGWYAARGHYISEELGGLSVARFCEALRAEGVPVSAGCNLPLHLHPIFQDADVYGHGKPTNIAHASRDLRPVKGSLPVAEGIAEKVFALPWFKHFRPELIDQYIHAFRKVCSNYEQLLADDKGNPALIGAWNTSQR